MCCPSTRLRAGGFDGLRAGLEVVPGSRYDFFHMPLFEVFIPASTPDGFNITARIRADSWIQALRSGLAKLGDTTDVRNILCDITESGIDVTEPISGRVFRIRELAAAAGSAAAAPGAAAVTPPRPTAPPLAGAPPPAAPVMRAPPPAAKPAAKRATPPPITASGPASAPTRTPPPVTAMRPAAPTSALPAQPTAAAATPAPTPTSAPVAAATLLSSAAGVKPTPAPDLKVAAPAGGRFHTEEADEEVISEKASPDVHGPGIGRRHETEPAARSLDDLIGELFEKTQEIYTQPDLDAAAGFILDLAMHVVTSESGSVFISDINRSDLYFAAARGPKAKEVLKFRVPMGQGIVGFSAQEGVTLAVSDVQKDERFYAAISKALGYETRSILCAPAVKDGRVFGAIELINRQGGSSYTPQEVDILNYLAHAFADYLMNTGQAGA